MNTRSQIRRINAQQGRPINYGLDGNEECKVYTLAEAKRFFQESLKDGKCSEDCPECNAMELAIHAIEFMESVVRCKDCAYWQDNNGGYPHEECRWGKGETPDADDYCSYGKRKEIRENENWKIANVDTDSKRKYCDFGKPETRRCRILFAVGTRKNGA